MFDCQICTNLTIKYLKYTLYVTIPLAGSPAAEGGQLKKGDVLVEVNGEDVYRKSVVPNPPKGSPE